MAKKKSVSFKAETLDELLVGQDPTTVLSSEGLLGDLKQALAERMLNAEMDVHLDSETEQQACNHRNGSVFIAGTAQEAGLFPVVATVRSSSMSEWTHVSVESPSMNPEVFNQSPESMIPSDLRYLRVYGSKRSGPQNSDGVVRWDRR